jgi:acyl-CoA dehydrogenase
MAFNLFREEHEIFRKTARDFFKKEAEPHAEEWESQGYLSREFWMKMGEMGMLGYFLDEKYGGFNADFLYSVIMCEEMARVPISGFNNGIAVHNDITVPYIERNGNEEQKQKWLPKCCSGEIITALGMTEPNCGSDLAAIRTTAIKDGDHYVINGQKTFISNGHVADLVVLACKTDPKAVPPHRGVSLIIVEKDAPGFIRGRKLDKIGRKAGDTSELFFEDCRVPVENLLSTEGSGFKIMMQNLQQERIISCLNATSGATYALEQTIEYTKSREAFGQPLSKFQHNAFKIAEMATKLEIVRTFIYSLIEDHINGEDVTMKCSMAKWYSTELANQVAYDCVQLHGGYGYMMEYPVAKFFADVRASTIAAGSTEIMKVIISRMLGL